MLSSLAIRVIDNMSTEIAYLHVRFSDKKSNTKTKAYSTSRYMNSRTQISGRGHTCTCRYVAK